MDAPSAEEIKKIVDLIKDDVSAQKSSTIKFGIRGVLNVEFKDVPAHLVDKILGNIIETGEYIYFQRPGDIDYNFTVFKNPNYKLNESIKSTNTSIQRLNTSLKRTNRWAVGIAAATGFFIAMQFFKDGARDLQSTNTQLKLQTQILDTMKQYQKDVRTSLQTMAKDSVKKIVVLKK